MVKRNSLSPIYGPVKSWRYGNCLGVDLLLQTSICSFNCIYCQLGNIERITTEQKVYVPTECVIEDLKRVNWGVVDMVAISGSGEPTLAINLGEVIHHIKRVYAKPIMILTNATMFHDAATRARVRDADIVDCKLDAACEAVFRKYNRPALGITLARVIEGIKALRAEHPGKIHLQCMFMPVNVSEAKGIAALILEIRPDLVQINTPRRPYPQEWCVVTRGSHDAPPPVPHVGLKTISNEVAGEIKKIFEETGVPIQSFDRA